MEPSCQHKVYQHTLYADRGQNMMSFILSRQGPHTLYVMTRRSGALVLMLVG